MKRSIARGKSEKNGDWSVEETVRKGRCYRRLIFLNSSGLIQSEVELIGLHFFYDKDFQQFLLFFLFGGLLSIIMLRKEKRICETSKRLFGL